MQFEKSPFTSLIKTTRRPHEFGELVTPKIQRPINQEAVDSIVKTELEDFASVGNYTLRGTISIAVFDGREHIIDGQHRLAAYKILEQTHPDRVGRMSIPVEVYDVATNDDMERLYMRVNMGTPVDIAVMGIDRYKLWNTVEGWFRKNFTAYLKTTARPNAPSISLALMKEKFDNSGILDLQWEPKELKSAVNRLNKFYAMVSNLQWKEWKVETKPIALIQAAPTQLYLGLYRAYEWVDRLIDMKVMGMMPQIHPSTTYRKVIPQRLQKEVWIEHSGEGGKPNDGYNGWCYCCNVRIDCKEFECGHIIALSRGGATNLENLRPVCHNCNRSMGTTNMNEFIKKIRG